MKTVLRDNVQYIIADDKLEAYLADGFREVADAPAAPAKKKPAATPPPVAKEGGGNADTQ